MSCVIDYIVHGWPSLFDESLKPYYRCRNELTIEANCLVRGHRSIIPDVLRRPLLEELHSVHIGMSRMMSVARSFFLCLAADVTFRLIYDIARCTVDVVVVGKRALTHCTFKLWYSLAAAGLKQHRLYNELCRISSEM